MVSKPLQKNYNSKNATEILNDIFDYKQNFSTKGDKLIINAFPKSGSSFLAVLLLTLTSYKTTYLTRYFEGSEQDLYYPFMLDNYSNNNVIQHHFKGTANNIELLSKFNYKIIVLVRNIFDIVPSLRDFIHNKQFLNILVGIYDKSFFEKEMTEQFDQIIQISLPWYFNFYNSWTLADKNSNLELLWLTYEELTDNTKQTLTKICNFYNLNKSQKEIDSTINKVQNKVKQNGDFTLLNQGITGRGNTLLADKQKEDIIKYARFYPDIDYSLIGIENS